jgi:23S rRNA (cytidine1920-2'-O)/16S rRNA (cytidine1409-2'-O)-methyltransferase
MISWRYPMATKKRLDLLLVEQGFFENRSKARGAIMAGMILVDGELVDKAGTQVKEGARIELKGEILPYVSRGGLKLEKALEVFAVDPAGKEAMDIGASTGGFTDCLLQKGAKKVYAIDVGYGQLDWKLRQDARVVVMERTNFRYLTPDQLPVKVPLIVTDVSFISLRLIIPPALDFLTAEGDIIALIKPQFEAGPERVGKNGIVREKEVHEDVLQEMIDFFLDLGLYIKGLDFSPITGASSGNIEFLIHLSNYGVPADKGQLWYQRIPEIVDKAHHSLEGG